MAYLSEQLIVHAEPVSYNEIIVPIGLQKGRNRFPLKHRDLPVPIII
jgi:hypothetical protein